MYHEYFGLKEPAFAIAVNPKYLYMSSQHKEALAHLLYGAQGGGFVLLSGEVGTGKTTIIRCLLEQLPENTEIAYILNPMANVEEMVYTICEELDTPVVSDDTTLKTMMDLLQGQLLRNHARGKRTVLLIDEAQLLSADVLEQLRLLTNLETATEKLLNIILVGQPEVNALLSQPRLRQLSQRITARFHLEPLNLEETKRYIEHRLIVAGKKESREIFPNHIVKKIHSFSGGIPRLINILCERLLIGAYGHNKFEINQNIYRLAIREVEGVRAGSNIQKQHRFKVWLIPGAAAIAAILLIILGYATVKYLATSNPQAEIAVSTSTSSALEPSVNTGSTTRQALENDTAHNTEYSDAIDNKDNSPYYSSSGQAYRQLFTYYDIPLSEETHPCWQTDTHLYSCSKVALETWQDLEALNSPAILSLITEDKNVAYAVLVGLNETHALLWASDSSIHEIPKHQVGTLWNGSLTYIWRKPKAYKQPLIAGAKSPVVAWVAEQFALLDGQPKPITETLFTARLQTRIKIFQTNSGLEEDGIIGERTIMKLNERVGLSKTLLRPLPKKN